MEKQYPGVGVCVLRGLIAIEIVLDQDQNRISVRKQMIDGEVRKSEYQINVAHQKHGQWMSARDLFRHVSLEERAGNLGIVLDAEFCTPMRWYRMGPESEGTIQELVKRYFSEEDQT